MGREPTNAEKIGLRRLFFESAALAVHEFKQRSERDEAAEPSKMPVAERNARLEDQKKRLQGIHFSPETEPSHQLDHLPDGNRSDLGMDAMGETDKPQQRDYAFAEGLEVFAGQPRWSQSFCKVAKP